MIIELELCQSENEKIFLDLVNLIRKGCLDFEGRRGGLRFWAKPCKCLEFRLWTDFRWGGIKNPDFFRASFMNDPIFYDKIWRFLFSYAPFMNFDNDTECIGLSITRIFSHLKLKQHLNFARHLFIMWKQSSKKKSNLQS